MSNMPPPPPPGAYPPDGAAQQLGPGGGAAPRRSKIPLAVAGLVLLALIGGAVWFFAFRDDDEATAPDITASELEGALLTEEDLGGGYTEDSEEDDSDELSPDDLDTSDECKDLIERFEGDEAAETKAERKFVQGEGGERQSFTHEISVPGEDSPDFDVLGDVVDNCAEVGFDDGEAVGTLRISEGDSPSIGDRSFAMDLIVEITEPLTVEISSQTIFWERDGLISSVQADGELGGEPDTDLLLEMVELADERLAEVIEDAG